jgi:murein DD-endopeptidase MepM/ murein hydrolase activator NlpD
VKRFLCALFGAALFLFAACAAGKEEADAAKTPPVEMLTDESLTGQGGFLAEPMIPETPALSYTVYRVKKGDVIERVAQDFGVTTDTLINANNIENSRAIQIDSYLRIPSMPGILYSAARDGETLAEVAEHYSDYDVTAENLAAVNNRDITATLARGDKIFVPNARLDRAKLQEINGDLFLWPLRGFRLTSYYSWRRSPLTGHREFHNGLDLAAPQGTPVYPARAGRVVSVDYNNTYGTHIKVAHDSSYVTMYGHLSAVDVSVGQYVARNTVIGKVGSTGLSTGPHLHFTIYKNGRTLNPATQLP